MKTNSNIAFFVKVSNSIGLGHFIRLVDLQKKLNAKHVIWIIAGKNKIIYSYVKKKYIYKTINFQSLNILKILKSNNITKIIMDLSSKEYLIKSEKAIARHMAITFQTTKKGYSKMIAGCHDADKTARAQIVTRKMNKDYHELISAFKKITDCGALLNTSFNLHGFPVVRNLKEAYEVLNKSDLDGLISKNYIFLKKKVRIIN